MLTSSLPEKALPGRENAKDWLTLKIVECLSDSMDDDTAQRLNAYNGAYNAVCQWGSDGAEPSKAKSSDNSPFSLDMAQKWAQGLQNEDGTTGPHWTLDQAKQIMAKRGISGDPNVFYAVLNSIYSDTVKVAKKYGVGGNMEYYVDMAVAWINDKDAVPDKAAAYYKYIVK